MNLFINEEKVDFTLESEKTLSDVVRSLEWWLAGQKMAIAGLSIDGKSFTKQDLSTQGDTPVENLGDVRVTASDFLNLEMEGVRVLTSFFRTLGASLRTDDAHVADLLARYPEAESTVRLLFDSPTDTAIDEKRSEWEKLFNGTTAGMIAMWDKDTRERAIGVCDFFIRVLEDKNSQYQRIEQSSLQLTRDTIVKLRDVTGRLTDIPVLLQTGKDVQAMRTIAQFTELAQLFIRLVSSVLTPEKAHAIMIDGVSVEIFSRDLNTRLHELVEAFEKKDYILIGDLCEYEIAPKMQAFIKTAEEALPAASA